MTTRRVLVVSAGLRTPSSTRLLADRLGAAAQGALADRGQAAEVTTVELREHARDLTTMLLTGTPTPALDELFAAVQAADAVVLVTPIYSGSYTGMVKDLVDLLPEDALAGVPVLMGGTGGTVRHALALEHTLRPLLGHVHAVTVPTDVFAATEDFGAAAVDGAQGADGLDGRVHRAARELADLVVGRSQRQVRDEFDVSDVERLLRQA